MTASPLPSGHLLPAGDCPAGVSSLSRARGAFSLTIPGEPQAWKRARGLTRFTHPEMRAHQERVREEAYRAGALPPREGPIRLVVVAVFGTKRKARWGMPHTFKPDGSNLLKQVEDALTGCAYRDDAQVADARCVKLWGETGETRITLEELDPLPA